MSHGKYARLKVILEEKSPILVATLPDFQSREKLELLTLVGILCLGKVASLIGNIFSVVWFHITLFTQIPSREILHLLGKRGNKYVLLLSEVPVVDNK